MKIKQKDILKVLKPYTMEVITSGHDVKVVRIDEFVAACIDKYKKQLNAVNVSYKVEYLNNESEVKND